VATSLSAQTVWTGGGGDNNWTTPQNWAGGVPPVPGSNTYLRFQGFTRLSPVADTFPLWIINRLEFDSRLGVGSGSFSISGTPLAFQGTAPEIINYSNNTQTISNDITTNGSDLIVENFISGLIGLTGNISGSSGLVLNAGVSLSGSNSYTGTTTINGYSVSITNGDALGAAGSSVALNWGILRLSGNITVRDKPLSLFGNGFGNGLVNDSGNNTWTGDITIPVYGGICSNSGILTITGGIDGQGNALQVGGAGDVLISGSVRNLTHWDLNKYGAGTLTLSGTNSNIGEILIYGGTVIATNRSAIPPDTFVDLEPFTGDAYFPAYPTLEIEDDITVGGLRGSSYDGASTIQLGSHMLTTNQGFYSTFEGIIVGSGGIVKTGTGTLELAGSNSYSGGTVINGGEVRFDSPASIGGAGSNVRINNAIASAGLYYSIDQAFLDRIDPASVGVVAACWDSNNSLDFGAAGLTNVRFGAIGGPRSYSGVLIPANSAYHLGGAGGTLNLTAANALSGNASLEIGPSFSNAGTVILSNNNSLTGTVTINGGLLQLNGAILNSGPIEVANSAVFTISQGTINSSSVTIDSGGNFSGCGTINADITNNGTIFLYPGCGTTQINGNITNNGTMTVISSTLIASGSFVNNGFLDLLTSPQTVLPPGFVNNGTVIDSSNVAIQTLAKSGNTFTVTIKSFTGHYYQLQSTPSLEAASVNWQGVGFFQSGNTGQILTFTDYNVTGSQMFYRVLVAP
jgi:fibronectin-binding autotransporter adhesin